MKGLRLKESVSTKVFEVLCPVSEVESVGDSLGSLVCVFVAPLSVPAVTVLFLNVHVACEAVFSDSDCEFVEPRTLSLTRKRKACCVESQENMNFDEAPVKAPPATRRKATPPTPQQSPDLTEITTRGNDDGGEGPGVSYVCPHCHCFPVEDCIWWDTATSTARRRSSATGGVQLVAASMIGGPRTGLGHTRQHQPPRSNSFSGARGTARNV